MPKVGESHPCNSDGTGWVTRFSLEIPRINITMITDFQMPGFVELNFPPPITDGSND